MSCYFNFIWDIVIEVIGKKIKIILIIKNNTCFFKYN